MNECLVLDNISSPKKPLVAFSFAPLLVITKTFHFKVREESFSWLQKASVEVNQVWNFSNNLHYRAYHNYTGTRKWMSAFDLNEYIVGCGETFDYIGSDIAQCVNAELATRCNQFKRSKLRFRKSYGAKKSLGWIPFKVANVRLKSQEEAVLLPPQKRQYENNKDYKTRLRKWRDHVELHGPKKKTRHSLTFMGKTIRIHQFDRYLNIHQHSIKIKQGNFSQDSLGNWYLNQVFDIAFLSLPALKGKNSYVGIDPGCETAATAVGFDENGQRFVHVFECSFYQDALPKLKILQQRGHLKQAKRLHNDIKNRRNHAIHEWSKMLIEQYESIYFGGANLLPKKNSRKNKKKIDKAKQEEINKLSKTQQRKVKRSQQSKKAIKMHKSVLDASWGKQKQYLSYKGGFTNRSVVVVSEKNTSVMCFSCKALTGPKGLSMLNVRDWVCSVCEAKHNRDENSAENMPFCPVAKTLSRAEVSASIEGGLVRHIGNKNKQKKSSA